MTRPVFVAQRPLVSARARTRFALLTLSLSAAVGTGCGGDEAQAASVSTGGLPCEVAQVVADKCASCHGDTPLFGAPMSLTSWSDFQAEAASGGKVYERVQERIVDVERPMPPADHAPLVAAEQAAIEAWIEAGAPKSSARCDADTGNTGVDADGGAPVVDDEEDVDLSECETVTELRAYAGNDPSSEEGYPVPLQNDHYECFTFDVPWEDKRQAFRIDPLIGDARVVHHWLLYSVPKSAPGQSMPCNGIHPDATLVSGWAPGGPSQVLPPDVGMQMPTGKDSTFLLEVHYNNPGPILDATDKSGVRLCTSSKLRENEAATHTLGTEALLVPPGPYSTGGTCSPTQKATILSVSPHMHRLGRRMKVELYRGTETKTVFDRGFDFLDQRVWQLSEGLEVGPGDRIQTTCTFMNDTGSYVPYGEATSNEMCLNFVLAYPVGALDTGSLSGGANRCME